MRIICPSCDAQYEVPSEVVPEEGRDVQCSNCGKTWFQAHPDFPNATRPDAETEVPEEPAPEPQLVQKTAPAAENKTAAPRPERQQLDPTVADILRQEAERETAARVSETKVTSLEMQPDLGLEEVEDSAERRAREARDRMARIRGAQAAALQAQESAKPATPVVSAPPAQPTAQMAPLENVGEAAATAAAVGSRRELLPDIEEINSTLRSASDRDIAGDDFSSEMPVKVRKRRSFRRGFIFAFLLFVIALLIYVFAPDIARALPSTDPFITSYVNWVDGLRAGLDSSVQGALQWLDTRAEQSANP